MFSSYGGVSSRSKSTTDIFRASSAELNDASSYEPAINYTHFRKNTNPAVVIHRRRVAAAPVPPQRSNSSLSIADASALKSKRVGPYLAADDGVHHEPGNVTLLPTQLSQSPGSKNFVKKLVATLERRQREHQQSVTATANNELAHKKNARNTIPGTRMQQIDRDKNYTARFNSEQVSQTLRRLPATQLEDLHERDENEDENEDDREDDEEEEDDWYDSADLEPQFWRECEEKTPVTSSLLLPIHIIEKKSADRNNNPTKSVKRTIKSMLSSFLNWKNSNKSLPKGSREYYAARESLGEEMRAFRRDTMPRLMERATVKAKLDRNNRSDANELGSSRDDQREFSQLIGSPIQKNSSSQLTIVDEEPPSIATIHPVYGSSSGSGNSSSNNHQRRSWHKPADFPEIDENKLVYGSVKVQPPTPPPRASQMLTSPAPSAELIRPSKVRELQKSISRESCYYSQVQLRRPPASSSSDNNKRNSIVYDVPRSNRRVEPAEDNATTVLVERKRVPGYISRVCTPPEYENVSGIIGARDDDKRLHCTAFTTF